MYLRKPNICPHQLDVQEANMSIHSSAESASLQILQEIQNNLQKRNVEPEEFTDRIILMSMFNDVH